jgi:hypothetical protein
MIELKKNLNLDDIWVGKSVKKHVCQFGLLIGIICLLIGALKLYFGFKVVIAGIWISLGSLLILLGYTAPALLKPVWYYWMKFALALGLLMTSILVGLAWFTMFVPVGLLFKLIGKKTIDVSIKKEVDTYWEPRDKKLSNFKLLERQF